MAAVVVAGALAPGRSLLAAQNGVMQGLESEIQSIFERTKDSVVRIKTIVPVTDSRKAEVVAEGLSVGTGFFVDGQGHIITAASVLRGADRAVVYWRGQTYEAQCLGSDLRTNLALLKIDAVTPSLPSGDPEALKVGSMAFAVGYPLDGPVSAEYGFVSDPSFISGFVSDQNATHMPQFVATSRIRCSARVQPGQSGSPLLNSKGEVVGVVVYALQEDGSTFALPITAARKIQNDLMQFHTPRHGWTGLTIEVRGDSLKTGSREIAIRDVFDGFPGQHAGIQPGDLLRKIGNREIHSAADVMNATFYLSIGETVNFTIERDHETLQLPLKVVERPSEKELAALKRIPATSSREH